MSIETILKEMKDKGMITEISVSWCAEDVLHEHPNLTAEQVQDVLNYMKHKHDCTIGINWDVIDIWANHVLNESEEQNA